MIDGSCEMLKTSRTTTNKNGEPNGDHPGVEFKNKKFKNKNDWLTMTIFLKQK